MDQWIDVEEHIPETDDDVLVWQKDYIYGDCDNTWEHFGIAHYSHEYNLWMGDWIEGKTTVLYWRELPKSPKKQNKDKIAFICLNCECVFETDDYTKDDDNVVQTCCPKCGYIVFDFGRKDH